LTTWGWALSYSNRTHFDSSESDTFASENEKLEYQCYAHKACFACGAEENNVGTLYYCCRNGL
jgi:hypothetical protein